MTRGKGPEGSNKRTQGKVKEGKTRRNLLVISCLFIVSGTMESEIKYVKKSCFVKE